MRREDDLVGAEGSERILDRMDGIGVAHLPARGDAGVRERPERAVEPLLRLRPRAVLVGGPVPDRRVQRGADDEDECVRLRAQDDLAA